MRSTGFISRFRGIREGRHKQVNGIMRKRHPQVSMRLCKCCPCLRAPAQNASGHRERFRLYRCQGWRRRGSAQGRARARSPFQARAPAEAVEVPVTFLYGYTYAKLRACPYWGFRSNWTKNVDLISEGGYLAGIEDRRASRTWRINFPGQDGGVRKLKSCASDLYIDSLTEFLYP